MKKLLILALTLALMLSLAAPAFAANTPISVRPSGVCVDGGQLVITDGFNKQILKGDGKNWTVIAGKLAPAGASGEPTGIYLDGKADEAYFMSPKAIVKYMDGYAVSDSEANVVRYVVNGIVRTLIVESSGLNYPTGLATDGENLYVSDTGNDRVVAMDKSGNVKVIITALNGPTGLSWANGTLYIAETGKNRIVSYKDGELNLVAGKAIADGEEYAGGYVNGVVSRAEFDHPMDVYMAPDGVLYIADTGNLAIRAIKDGRAITLTDAKDIGYQATDPRGIVGSGSTIYVADYFYPYVVNVGMASKSFSDVAPGAWYAASVAKASTYGIINGFTDGTFRAEQPVTRAQFVTMLKNTALFIDGTQVIGGTPDYTDVKGDEWFANNLGWAQEAGYLKNLPDFGKKEFCQSFVLTRDELALLAYNFAMENGLNVKTVSDAKLSDFSDSASVEFTESMQWAITHGVVSGFTDKTLRPNGQGSSVNRAQAAAILSRLIENAGY